jgi:hypothetical protein
VRDDCETLSTRETDNSKGPPENPVEGGVLAALPRTRPQRTSPRRAAARQRAGKAESEPRGSASARSAPKTAASPKTARKATPTQTAPKAAPAVPATEKAAPDKVKAAKTARDKPTSTKTASPKTAPPKTKAASAGNRKAVEAPAPKQGYEPEEEVELGKTVNPPSGVELVESVADIFGELANSSLAAGGRILKDAFSLLRRP